MEYTLVETEVRVKDEPVDTNTQGHGLIDLISDWKLHPNVECRVTLVERIQNIPPEIPPSVESQVRRRNFSGLQMDDETNTRSEHVEEFLPLDDKIDIKYEESGIENNSTSSNPEGDHDQDIDLSIFPNMKPKPGAQSSIISEKLEPNALYSLLLMCEQDCETCQKYIRKLSEHIRATHAACQPTTEPLLIDPLEMDEPSAIEHNCEVGEDIERKESESDPDNSESGSESENDPDYMTSPVMTTKAHGKGSSRKVTITAQMSSRTERNESKIRFNCTNCGKDDSLKCHYMTTHTEERLLKCPKCERSFSQEVILDYHMRSHTEEKRFNCDLCLKVLGSLSSTMSALTAALPASASSTSTMANSVTPSTSSATYPCSRSKTFSRRFNAVRHEKCHDKLIKKLKCTLCPTLFAQQAYLDAHMSRKHGLSKKAHC